MRGKMYEIKVPKNKVKKQTSLTDLYIWYSHIKRPNEGTIVKPYVPKSRFSDHEYALDLKTWRKIIKVYLENIQLYLLLGHAFRPNQHLGQFSIKHYKKKNPFRNFYHVDKEKLAHTWGTHCPFVLWEKKDKYQYEFLGSYGLQLSESFSKLISKTLTENPDYIFNFDKLIRTKLTKINIT